MVINGCVQSPVVLNEDKTIGLLIFQRIQCSILAFRVQLVSGMIGAYIYIYIRVHVDVLIDKGNASRTLQYDINER